MILRNALSWSLAALAALTSCSFGGSGAGPQAAPTVEDGPQEDREAYAAQHALELRQYDLNRDGRPDVFKFVRAAAAGAAERLERKEVDINHDGKIDVVRTYGEDGKLVQESTDLDFDGRFDQQAYFEGSALVRKEIDLNYDGRPDVTKYYQQETLARVESDRNGDGRTDAWEYYENGELDRLGVDTDGD
ncbi:MAG: hypothetical protein AAB426_11585, partial [Myxococcota bacterium]